MSLVGFRSSHIKANQMNSTNCIHSHPSTVKPNIDLIRAFKSQWLTDSDWIRPGGDQKTALTKREPKFPIGKQKE